MSSFLTKIIGEDFEGNEVDEYYQLCGGCGEPVIDGLEIHGTAYCDEICGKHNGYTDEELRILWEQYTDEGDCPIFYTDWIGAYTEEDYKDYLV